MTMSSPGPIVRLLVLTASESCRAKTIANPIVMLVV